MPTKATDKEKAYAKKLTKGQRDALRQLCKPFCTPFGDCNVMGVLWSFALRREVSL